MIFGTNILNKSTGGFKSQRTTMSNKSELTSVSRTNALKTSKELVDITPNVVHVQQVNSSKPQFDIDLSEERLKTELLDNITPIVDEIIEEDKIFQDIDKESIYQLLPKILDSLPIEKIPLDKNEIKNRLKKILALEVMSNLLNDLTPEELETFNETVSRGHT